MIDPRTFFNFADAPLYIGYHGENLVTGVDIDLANVLPDGWGAALLLRRPGDGKDDEYEAVSALEGSTLHVTFETFDTMIEGRGEATIELRGPNGEKKKSHTALTSIPHALDLSGVPPERPELYRTAAAQDVIDAAKLNDAPKDGKEYARKNGAWAEVIGGEAEPEIVYLEYGVSAYEEALAAYNAGKTLLLKYNMDGYGSIYVPLTGRPAYNFIFASTIFTNSVGNFIHASLNATEGWGDSISIGEVDAGIILYDSENEYDDGTVGAALQGIQAVIPSGAATSNKLATAADLQAVADDLSDVQDVIPDSATAQDKLVTTSQMGDAIEAVEAKQIYKTSAQGSFATKAELTAATTFYNADGTIATPTKNDVAYVLADESHEGKAAKYVIASIDEDDGSIMWGFVITFSNTSFTQAQMNAINSGITAEKVAQIGALKTASGTLTAGQTSVSIAFGGTAVSVKAKDATTGETVITDVTETTSGVTVSIAAAYTNNIAIKVLYE